MSCGHTDEGVITALMQWLPRYGLVPFRVRRESDGFIFNRIWAAIKRECLMVVEEGVAGPEDADRGRSGHGTDLGSGRSGRCARPAIPAGRRPRQRWRLTMTPAPFETAPVVGLIMGSDSDWRVMSAAGELLDEFGVPFEVGVVSAHRTPQRMLDYAGSAAGRGLRVIIAGAGGAAHLPGMVASATVLPVIGVPVPLATLDGMDSLLSIVQMPAGIPVACVSIGGARNAGLLAVRILASAADDDGRALALRLAGFADDLQATVLAKHAALRERSGH